MEEFFSDYSPDQHSPDFIPGISSRALVAACRAVFFAVKLQLLNLG
jgi:hypothetical protein